MYAGAEPVTPRPPSIVLPPIAVCWIPRIAGSSAEDALETLNRSFTHDTRLRTVDDRNRRGYLETGTLIGAARTRTR
ncbi:hypothetical protein KM043_013229 [Ampulex compressa]|nr:hypothetical protein KM043_013229 [Ampulex compressa]